MKFTSTTAIAFSFSLGLLAAEPSGKISVRVIDQQGNPVQHAVVKLEPLPHGSISFVSPSCKTDENGTCTRTKLDLGTYLVGAEKPADGYPNLMFEFYGHDVKRPKVTLTLDKPEATVDFTLGVKAAKLKVNLVDDATDKPVENPGIILRSGTDYVSIAKSADSIVLIPSDKDIQLEISAPGYQPWRLKDHPEVNAAGVLRYHSGEVHEINVRLKHE